MTSGNLKWLEAVRDGFYEAYQLALEQGRQDDAQRLFDEYDATVKRIDDWKTKEKAA